MGAQQAAPAERSAAGPASTSAASVAAAAPQAEAAGGAEGSGAGAGEILAAAAQPQLKQQPTQQGQQKRQQPEQQKQQQKQQQPRAPAAPALTAGQRHELRRFAKDVPALRLFLEKVRFAPMFRPLSSGFPVLSPAPAALQSSLPVTCCVE